MKLNYLKIHVKLRRKKKDFPPPPSHYTKNTQTHIVFFKFHQYKFG